MYSVIKAKRNFAITGFREFVANGRREAAACGNKVGESTKKGVGYSACAGSLMNVEKHSKTLFAKKAVRSKYVYHPLLQDVEVHLLFGANLDGVQNRNI